MVSAEYRSLKLVKSSWQRRNRALSKEEIGLFYKCLEKVGTTPSIRAACKLLLLTLLRKGELNKAMWTDIHTKIFHATAAK